MVVDDQQKALESLELILVQHGYQVTTVDNGRQAMELLDRQQFDLALLDLRMDYRLRKSFTLEFEGGLDWYEDENDGVTNRFTDYFFLAGYRWDF